MFLMKITLYPPPFYLYNKWFDNFTILNVKPDKDNKIHANLKDLYTLVRRIKSRILQTIDSINTFSGDHIVKQNQNKK